MKNVQGIAAERGETVTEQDIYTEGLGAHSGRNLKRRPAMRRLIERELENAKRALYKGLISDGDFRKFSRECAEDLAKLDSEPDPPVSAVPSTERVINLMRDFPTLLNAATNQERNILLRDLITGIYVTVDGDYTIEWQDWAKRVIR